MIHVVIAFKECEIPQNPRQETFWASAGFESAEKLAKQRYLMFHAVWQYNIKIPKMN